LGLDETGGCCFFASNPFQRMFWQKDTCEEISFEFNRIVMDIEKSISE
jgi:hypothetical protein